MASKKSYSRYFIILQEDEKGYALEREKSSSGYVKLERRNNKCKVSFYAQNINPDMEPYYMVLVCTQKDSKKLIVVGKLSIDEQGKMDVTKEYDINNVGYKKVQMEHISGAAIAKVIDNNIISLMSGFTSNNIPKDWKDYKVIKAYEKDKVETKKEEKPKQEKSRKEDNNKNVIEEKVKDIKQDNNQKDEDKKRKELKVKEELSEKVFKEYEDKIQEKVEDIKEETKTEEQNKEEKLKIKEEKQSIESNLEENIELNIEDDKLQKCSKIKEEKLKALNEDSCINDEIDDEELKKQQYLDNFMNVDFIEDKNTMECFTLEEIMRKKKKHKQCKCKDNKYKEYECKCKKKSMPIGAIGDYFNSIICGFEVVDYIGNEIPNCMWYKIPIKSLDDMYDNSDVHKYTILYYPMICYYSYICKYKHFCVGYKCNKEGKLLYVLYAIPGKKDKIHQPYEGKTGFVTWIPCKDKKEHGYWIMFYDFKNSTVVVPIKR